MFMLTSCVRSVSHSNRSTFLLRRCLTGVSVGGSLRRLLSSVETQTNSKTMVLKRLDNITKSPEDLREYRGLELANGLRVLLVSDPQTDKSAAALDVNVGHLMDPWELPGLAHFCEHMLFLGTDKYPSENEYSKFISANAGGSNAYTSTDQTNYHFDIKPDQLEGALDRFAQFFLSPQFTESATEREVCAVDSEHSNNLNNDGWRNLQVDRSMTRPGHDYGKFGTGNKQTLLVDAKAKGIEPRDALLKFHGQWYSSNIMSLCVVGRESLDEMEGLLGTLAFDQIKDKKVERKEWNELHLGAEQLKKRIHIVPIRDSRSLKMTFPMPDMRSEYRSKPAGYLSHLIGHEGPGSLLSELKRRGWVSSLNSGDSAHANGFGEFNVAVDLSAEGVEHVEEIVELVFQYIGMLRREGPKQWIQDEIRDIGAARFIFKDKESPLHLATTLASRLQKIPFEDILSSSVLVDEYKPDLISEILSMLVPENMCYRVVSKKFAGQEGNTTEPVYGTEINVAPIDESAFSRFQAAMDIPHENMRLPERNEYIPTKFALKERDVNNSDHPRVIYDDVWCRVWFKQDDEYKLPKAITKVAVTAPVVSQDPRSAMLSSLYLWCLNDALAEETYNAELCQLKCQLDAGPYGINTKVSGFDEKQHLFVQHLINRLVTFKPDPARFVVIFDSIKRALENFAHSQPYALSQHYMMLLLSQKFWSKEQLLHVCQDMTVEDVTKFGQNMLEAFHVEVMMHGNCTEKEALSLAADVTNTLRSGHKRTRPLFSNEYQALREHSLENGDSYVYRHYQNTHDVSAVEALFQIGVQNTKENAMAELLVQLLKEPAFNQLRTVEQLGYIVWTGTRLNAGTLGLQVIVQGPKSPDFVQERINAFLDNSRSELVSMSDEEFAENVEGLAVRLLEKPKTLGKRFNRFWTEVEARQYDFHRDDNEVEVIRSLSKEDVIAFFDRKLAKDAPERRQLSVYVHGKGETKEDVVSERKKRDADSKTATEVECIENLRSSLGLYGRPKPKMNLRPIGADTLGSVEMDFEQRSSHI